MPRRDASVAHFVGNFLVHYQPVPETRLLDLDVPFDEVQLLLQRNLLIAAGFER